MRNKEVDLAYMAGIIDGEGAVMIRKRADRRTYSAQVTVSMCVLDAVNLLHTVFGGTIHKVQCDPPHRDYYQWVVAATKASVCAWALSPYLRIKRQQAVNLIELQEINQAIRASTTEQRSRRFGRLGHFGAYDIDPELAARADQLYEQNKVLNKRGVDMPTKLEAIA